MRLVDADHQRVRTLGKPGRAARLEPGSRGGNPERHHAHLLGGERRELGDLTAAELARGEDEARPRGARDRELVERARPEPQTLRPAQRPHVVERQHAGTSRPQGHEVERAQVDRRIDLAQQLADLPQRGHRTGRETAFDPGDPGMPPDRLEVEARVPQRVVPDDPIAFVPRQREQAIEQRVGVGADPGVAILGEPEIVGDERRAGHA